MSSVQPSDVLIADSYDQSPEVLSAGPMTLLGAQQGSFDDKQLHVVLTLSVTKGKHPFDQPPEVLSAGPMTLLGAQQGSFGGK